MQISEQEKTDKIDSVNNDASFIADEPQINPVQSALNEAINEIKPKIVDIDGAEFDPDIHCVMENGEPRYTKSGRFRKRKSKDDQEDSTLGSFSDVSSVEDIKRKKAMVTGMAIAESIISLGKCIGGDEWEPTKIDSFDERKNLYSAWSEYCYATDTTELPPWLGVSIVTGSYVLPRLTKPTTKSRLQGFFLAIKSRLTWVRK